MRKYLLLFCMAILANTSFAQAKLEKLLKDREKLHQEWKESESKKSGIFGNRTKKDMVETLEWMERIIHKDNQIMDELKLLSEIEKTEITYEKNDYKFIVQKQEREITMLKKALEEQQETVKKSSHTFEWLSVLFLISTIALGFLYRKKSKEIPTST